MLRPASCLQTGVPTCLRWERAFQTRGQYVGRPSFPRICTSNSKLCNRGRGWEVGQKRNSAASRLCESLEGTWELWEPWTTAPCQGSELQRPLVPLHRQLQESMSVQKSRKEKMEGAERQVQAGGQRVAEGRGRAVRPACVSGVNCGQQGAPPLCVDSQQGGGSQEGISPFQWSKDDKALVGDGAAEQTGRDGVGRQVTAVVWGQAEGRLGPGN